jgi:hypothetical protein
MNRKSLLLEDDNGVFEIYLTDDLSQIHFITDAKGDFPEDVYFNCNHKELEQIANFILDTLKEAK